MSAQTENIIDKKKELLERIIKARESIKRKHLALKLGRETAQQIINENLKPITKPLEKIEKFAENLENQNYDKTSVLQLPSSTPFKSKNKIQASTWNDGFNTALSVGKDDENVNDIDDKNANEENSHSSYNSNISSTQNITPEITSESEILNASDYLDMFKFANKKTSLDTKFGVRKMTDGSLKIGDTQVEFKNGKIHLGDLSFPYSTGLLELIFKKNPINSLIKPEDMDNYKKIIISTNAARKWYLPHEAIHSNTSKKFINYVSQVLNMSMNKTGEGISKLPKYMVTSNEPVQYVHWDDPNELVIRLRLLISERQAGNNNHENEIHSIIEELREEKIIY